MTAPREETTPSWPGKGDTAPRLPLILLYHSISDPSRDPWGVRVHPEHFAAHMRVIAAHCTPMRLRDVDAALKADRVPPRSVVVTFDDGYIDNLMVAKPFLERAGIPGTVFVASGYVGSGQEFWWDELDRLLLQRGRMPPEVTLTVGERRMEWRLGADARLHWLRWRWQQHNRFFAYEQRAERLARWTPRQRMYRELWDALRSAPSVGVREDALRQLQRLSKPAVGPRGSCRACSPEQLRQLAADGLIEIGAHTVNHPSLGSLSIEEQRYEIVECKRTLESIVQQPVTSFAYPIGQRTDYSADTIRLLREAGFERACINADPRSAVSHDVDRFQYPRLIASDWDGNTFSAKLAAWFEKFDHEMA
ncbi:MAG TPA: polysaccharide deacetylase family protein [Phycisphaerales bacterium]|nr:polysaccharide deacetylase family protein [Phycisphaerales bacterium]